MQLWYQFFLGNAVESSYLTFLVEAGQVWQQGAVEGSVFQAGAVAGIVQ